MNLDSHLDVDFCREMGEQILIIPVGKNSLLKSNGKQGDVYANARKADMIRRIGSACTRNLLHLNILHREELVDLLVMEHYPKRVSRADPPNLWPTVKHLIDGMTDAGLWPDDDSTISVAPSSNCIQNRPASRAFGGSSSTSSL